MVATFFSVSGVRGMAPTVVDTLARAGEGYSTSLARRASKGYSTPGGRRPIPLLARRACETKIPLLARRACVGTVVAVVLALGGCNPPPKHGEAAYAPAAKVAKIAHEGELNTIELSPDQEQRLGIATELVATRPIPRVRSYGGEAALPAGASIIVSAPLGGRLAAPDKKQPIAPGALVANKQPIFLLTPLLSPERDVLTPAERLRLAEAKNTLATSRVDAENQWQQAQVQLAAARLNLDRAQRLFRDSAGTARAVDDAQAQVSIATKSLEAAASRKKLIEGISLNAEEGQQAPPMVMEAPQAGMLRTKLAAAGEVVAAGAPLFEVIQCDPIWVRVPVYAGELPEVAQDQPAQVSSLTSASGQLLAAAPVAAPPTATPLASTIDLYFQVPNPNAEIRPGQRMTAQLRLTGSRDERVIPWSAVIHDIHGGAWVYEQKPPHTFVRHRVQVRAVVDSLAVLQSGPPNGTRIVTAGVVELFGLEFGFAK